MRRIACMAVLAFSLPLTGCIHMSRSVLSSAHAANPVPKERVQVYLPGDPVPSHERIAILNTRTGAGSFAESEIVERLREEAGKLGANALLLDYLSTGQTGLVAGLNGERPERRSGALAIYVDGLAADGVQSVPARAGAAPSSAAPRLLVWPGRRVRFESGGTWTGVVERTTPDSVGVLLDGDGVSRTFALSSTERFRVSEGRGSFVRGLQVGAAVGTGVGALTGLVVWLAGDDECTGDDPLNLCEDLGEVVRALEMAAYSAAGTVVGGAIGAALSMRERWANVGMLMPAVTASGTPGLVWRGQLPF